MSGMTCFFHTGAHRCAAGWGPSRGWNKPNSPRILTPIDTYPFAFHHRHISEGYYFMYQNVNSSFPASWPLSIQVAPEELARIQAEFSGEYLGILEQARTGSLPPPTDRRFQSEAWRANPLALLNAHLWQLSSRAMNRMVDAAQVSESLRNRLRFSVMQWLEATAPTNFIFTNPEVQQLLLESGGQSLASGMRLLLEDISKGRMSQTDESGFELGVNIAVTPGSVVYQNSLMQVIQYAPLTDKVHARPLLIVPPCINKY